MSDAAAMLRDALPLRFDSFDAAARPTGLVIVDIVNGFATVGAGALAPPAPDQQVARMVRETDALARAFIAAGRPVLAFLDSHVPGKPEPPYPPHCEIGSGEEQLVPELAWLEAEATATLVRKDCINGFVGAMDVNTGRNAVADWVNGFGLESVLVVGICTDICVMDFVLTLLSARNHGLMPSLAEVAVFEPGCATYDLPRALAVSLGLPETAAHPKAVTHHAGLYFMASRGARLVDAVA
ncbi:isochorismatase family protein [Magnetospirillum sp. UT-4]|uniref:isochorismatase family protein n=1 Tax=Magnetospirillum sp. UT-4 TaxID=2681467 RepID=UPI00138441F1|nr:isochorismatase family protein [Magnetospirillum sp. UT-4]CAA7613221.1 Isochorismatase hydrolase [Magnetospirillum sp. UT-4]